MNLRFLFLISFVLLVGGCQTTSGQSIVLKPGMIVENYVQINEQLPIQVPLPEGKWEVGAVQVKPSQQRGFNSIKVEMLSGFLFQLKGGKLAKAIVFIIPAEINYGYWWPSHLCQALINEDYYREYHKKYNPQRNPYISSPEKHEKTLEFIQDLHYINYGNYHLDVVSHMI